MANSFVFFFILTVTVLFHVNFVWFYQSISFVPLGKKGAHILHLPIILFLKRDFDQFKIVLVFLFTTSVNFALTVNVLHSSLFIYVRQQLVLKQNYKIIYKHNKFVFTTTSTIPTKQGSIVWIKFAEETLNEILFWEQQAWKQRLFVFQTSQSIVCVKFSVWKTLNRDLFWALLNCLEKRANVILIR